ncbi:MAG: acetyl-CoA carboxylase biotin carboxyl carrier protein [Verrucomicrobiales bacterium]
MEIKEIKQVIELMNEHDLSLFHLERDGVKIKLKKGADLDAVLAALAQNNAPAQQPNSNEQGTSDPQALPAPVEEVSSVPVYTITSPTVGTFYRQAEPESPPFVKIGDKVDEDTVVCIIEAMKVMNEIKAETKGTIQRILADDSKPVQYGDSLFEIIPG